MSHNHDLSCHIILENLSDYLDGELDADLCTDIERHISGCQHCQVVVNTLKKTIQIYQVTGHETTLPPEIRRRLYARFSLEDYVNKD